jgi:membrane protease YdiL (CAAX protease family)
VHRGATHESLRHLQPTAAIMKSRELRMPKPRFLLEGLLKLGVAAACLVGAIVAYRLLLDPVIDAALRLGPQASSLVRRVNILAAAVLSYWVFARYYERRVPRELSLRARWTLVAAVAGVLSIGITILALHVTGHYRFTSFRGFGGAIDILGQIGVAAVIEELAFRAILFRILEERTGTRAALFGSAAIFCVAHAANNGVGWVTFITVTLAGLMWALIYVAWRNVWVVAAHHCCWNATIFLTGLPLSGEDWRLQAPLRTAIHGPILWTGGIFGPEDSVLNIVVSIALCVALWQIARRSPTVVRPPARS